MTNKSYTIFATRRSSKIWKWIPGIDKKWAAWVEKSCWIRYFIPEYVVSFSDETQDENIPCTLSYGASFALSARNMDIVIITNSILKMEKKSVVKIMTLYVV